MKRKNTNSEQSFRPRKIRVNIAPKINKWVVRQPIDFPIKINTIDDLLTIAWNYKGSENTKTFDWTKLWLLIPSLTELRNMVGMEDLKTNIIDLILYCIGGQDFCTTYFHTIISGPYGCGKTEVANIIAKIYIRLGLTSDKLTSITRDELVGVKNLLEKAQEGILFVDESCSPSDDFSSVIDILNKNLPTTRQKLTCIIIANDDDIEKYFFSISLGTKTKFPWHFSISKYSAKDLLEIFKYRVKGDGWLLDEGAITEDFFVKNSVSFLAYGRDIFMLVLMCKMAHTKNIFATTLVRYTMTKEDIKAGFNKYKNMVKKEHIPPSYIG